MRLLNEQYEEILESDIDLTIGKIFNATIIRPDAIPIDDITKFAWADEDYEEVKIYHKYTEEELNRRDKPSQLDIIEAQVTYTAMMTDTLLEV